jgi:membrane-associated protease RseP (regulator of RpoE activity)
VESEEQLRRLIRETPPGRTVTLGISRDGNPVKIDVQLADRAKIGADSRQRVVIPKIPRIEIPQFEGNNFSFPFQVQTYSLSLGIQAENLSRQLGEFFGVKDGEGVLIRSVEKGSAAEKAGLKAGDVIVRADNEKLSDRTDLSRILRNHRDGGKLSLVIVREKHEQTVAVDLPQRSSRNSWWDNSGSGWGQFDPDELKGLGDEMEKWLDQVEPEMEHAREMVALQARSQLAKAQQQLREARPQIDRAMRQAKQELERSRKTLEQQQKELRNRLNNLV